MISVTRNERVVTVAIDCPPVNVLDAKALNELNGKLQELAGDESIAAILVMGAGRCFSAGASVEDHEKKRAPGMIAALADVCKTLSELPMATAALVHGPCMGGGLEVALFCDFIVADPGAKFGVPEITLAFFPPFACYQLPKLTGLQNANYLALTGETIDVPAAQAMGLVQKVSEKDEWGRVEKKFNRLSLPVLRMTKQALRMGRTESLEAQTELFLGPLYEVEDLQEGIDSFAEKRRPEWKHR
jgi:cyclohexa-1,5-dienecarbonyl-CoA hydratase